MMSVQHLEVYAARKKPQVKYLLNEERGKCSCNPNTSGAESSVKAPLPYPLLLCPEDQPSLASKPPASVSGALELEV